MNFLISITLLYAYTNLDKRIYNEEKEIESRGRIIIIATFNLIFFPLEGIFLILIRYLHLLFARNCNYLEACLGILINSLILYYILPISYNTFLSLLIPAILGCFLSRKLVIIAYVIIFSFIEAYIYNEFYLSSEYLQGIIALIMILLTPKKIEDYLLNIFSYHEQKANIKENEMYQVEKSINNIIEYLDLVLENKINLNYSLEENAFKILTEKVCVNCKNYSSCKLKSLLIKKLTTKFNKEEKEYLYEECFYPNKIMKNLRLGINSLNNEKRLIETISLKNHTQYHEIENIYRPLINVFNNTSFINKIKISLIKKLENHHYQIADLSYFNNTIKFKISLDNKEKINKVISIINEHLNCTYYLLDMYYLLSENKYQISLTSSMQYKIEDTFLTIGYINGINGDCFVKEEANNKYVFMLSDGMGHNKNSAYISKFLIKSLQAFRKIELNPLLQIENINHLLNLKIEEEMYATLDYLIIDLVSGKMELYKCGSFSSYLYRNNKLFKFKSVSPPLGIIDNIKVEPLKKELMKDDILIFLSDGYGEDIDIILKEILEKNKDKTLKEMEGEINKILSEKYLVKDDKTLAIFKIHDR